MQTVQLFKDGRVFEGLAVTKKEIGELLKEYPFLKTSEYDERVVEKMVKNDNDTAGYIIGDIDCILKGNKHPETEATAVFVTSLQFYDIKRIVHDQFTFGEAIELLKLGYKVARYGWNGNKLPPKVSPYPKYTPKERMEIKGDYIYLLLSNGDVAVTDATPENIKKLSKQQKWSISHGYPYYTDYSNNSKKTVKLHQYLYDCPNGLVVDHINGDKLDNRAENIRFVTPQANNVNRRNKSGKYKGVSFDTSRGKWIVSIQINGKTKHIGRFDDEEEAAKAYDDKAYELHGEYAKLNFPDRKLKPRMWLVYVPGSEVEVREGTPYWNAGLRGKIKIDGHIDMYTAQGTMQPGWLASQADMQAEDWVVVTLFEQKTNE